MRQSRCAPSWTSPRRESAEPYKRFNRMRRSQLFDPPEYFNWSADADLVREFGEKPTREEDRAAIVRDLDEGKLLAMYEGLLRARLLDYAQKRWVRQGVISKAWLATGEEAVT